MRVKPQFQCIAAFAINIPTTLTQRGGGSVDRPGELAVYPGSGRLSVSFYRVSTGARQCEVRMVIGAVLDLHGISEKAKASPE
jgi:hypothetical protein